MCYKFDVLDQAQMRPVFFWDLTWVGSLELIVAVCVNMFKIPSDVVQYFVNSNNRRD